MRDDCFKSKSNAVFSVFWQALIINAIDIEVQES